MFGSKHKEEITESANLMADVIIGVHDGQRRDDGAELISARGDLAYLQGFRIISHRRLGTFDTRRLIKGFKVALADRKLSKHEIDVHVAQFWVYYWTMIVGDSVQADNRFAERLALKRVRQSRRTLDLIKQQKNGPS